MARLRTSPATVPSTRLQPSLAERGHDKKTKIRPFLAEWGHDGKTKNKSETAERIGEPKNDEKNIFGQVE